MVGCWFLSHCLPHSGFLPHCPISFPRLPSLVFLELCFIYFWASSWASSFIFFFSELPTPQGCRSGCNRDVGEGMGPNGCGYSPASVLVLGGKVRLPLASEQSATPQHLAPASDTFSLSSSTWWGKQQRKHLHRICLSKISRAELSLSACTALPVLMHDSLIAT